ncbi:MAG TPA: tryptophan synthase subunit alpha [Dehalococcoidia bacterium]|nr:tryptophan synthase subunit alpha [Dehalococcoidia bacterium]
MSRIAATLARHKALIAYLTVGYPSVDMTLEIVPALADWGCDLVELGIPFSDPLADGTTIQKASYQALQNKVTPRLCLEIASQLRQKVDIPLVFMTYYNPVFSFGLEAFCQASAEAGIDGLIIPDLPPEEGAELEASAGERGLDLIYLLTPTSSEKRITLVAKRSRGFIYLVSLTGVTGARKTLPADLEEFVTRVRKRTSLPLCVGFGISTPEQARRVARIADGIIVGSRLIQLLDEHPLHELKEFVGGLRNALDSVENSD